MRALPFFVYINIVNSFGFFDSSFFVEY